MKKTLELCTAKELAEMLSLSVRTVWRLRSAGKLPQPVMVGGSCRWRVSDIEGYLDVNCDMNRFESMRGGK
ncbi:helix-turn-helix transcriptional regulator [Planctomycetota bacterium]